jgi:glycosyltransferase involved in cell wall biosynthesis
MDELKMNVLVLASTKDTINSIRPEAEIYVSLSKLGVNMTILTEEDSDYSHRFKEYGIEVIDCKYGKKIDFKLIKQIRKVIMNNKIDVIYATSSRTISNAIFACLGTNVKLATYRGTAGGLYKYDPSAYLNALNPRVNGVICVSDSVTKHVKKQVSSSKLVQTIYKGHKLEWYKRKKIDLSEFGTNEKNFNIAFVANVRPHKGLIYLLEAAKELSGIKNLHILLIGKKISQEPYVSAIENSGMKERIHLTGYRTDVPDIISNCDILVHASIRKEGLPRVILEALASGTPVVASSNESSLEIIEDGVNGAITPIKDSQALANKIKEIHNNPEILQKLKQNSDNIIKTKMSHDETVKSFLRYFQTIQD